MLKWIRRIFMSAFVVAAGLIAFKVSITPQMLIPYPYRVDSGHYLDWEEAGDAQVLIVGDRMAKTLSHYQDPLVEMSSEGLRNPLRIYNWAHEGEGIHRTLARLKFLAERDSLPRVIVYQGASEEFYEKRFDLDKYQQIIRNFEIYSNDAVASTLILLPWLSRLLYMPVPQKQLPLNIEKDDQTYTSEQTQKLMELTFKFYAHHLQEMVALARAHDSTLVLTTTPVNLEEPPRRVCANTEDQEIFQQQQEIAVLFEEGRYKEAYSRSEELLAQSTANARSSFMFGEAAKFNNRLSEAREALAHAAAVDCATWRINPVFNAIIAQQAANDDLYFIDFDRMLNQQLGQNVLFLNAIYPQHLFYQRFTRILAREIRDILRI